MSQYLKKNLTRALITFGVILLVLVILTILDVKFNVISNWASNLL